jgi:hypothetical protein
MTVPFGIVVYRGGHRSICNLDLDFFSPAILAPVLGLCERFVRGGTSPLVNYNRALCCAANRKVGHLVSKGAQESRIGRARVSSGFFDFANLFGSPVPRQNSIRPRNCRGPAFLGVCLFP